MLRLSYTRYARVAPYSPDVSHPHADRPPSALPSTVRSSNVPRTMPHMAHATLCYSTTYFVGSIVDVGLLRLLAAVAISGDNALKYAPINISCSVLPMRGSLQVILYTALCSRSLRSTPKGIIRTTQY